MAKKDKSALKRKEKARQTSEKRKKERTEKIKI